MGSTTGKSFAAAACVAATSLGCGGRVRAEASTAPVIDASASLAVSSNPNVADVQAQDAPSCPTPGIFLITSNAGQDAPLYTIQVFNPATGVLSSAGPLPCNLTTTSVPVSGLAVDGNNVLYVNVGNHYVLPTQVGGTCGAMAYMNGISISTLSLSFGRFGVGSVDILYGSFFAASGGPLPSQLGTYDWSAAFQYTASRITLDGLPLAAVEIVPPAFAPAGPPCRAMTATSDGRLFGLLDDDTIVQIDPRSGAVLETFSLADASVWGGTTALGFWAGAVYAFVPYWNFDAGPTGSTTDIVRLDWTNGTATTVATVDGIVFAANSSTCAPLE